MFPDWMHSADMGAAQDVIAHVFHELLPSMEGTTLTQRCGALFALIKQYYKTFQVKDQLDALEPKMFTVSGDGKANKMKCKAAVARHLVPFLPIVCRNVLSSDNERHGTIQALVNNLAECYRLMADSGSEDLQKASRRFANSYTALEAAELLERPDSAHWRIKPKLHLFQELCEFGTRDPRSFWCYQDESFGNVAARLSVRRGGKDNAAKNTESLLNAWCCSQAFPRP